MEREINEHSTSFQRFYITCPRTIGSLSLINSSFIPKHPLIDGENMKYSEKRSILNPIHNWLSMILLEIVVLDCRQLIWNY
jgi:hypothetical protein